MVYIDGKVPKRGGVKNSKMEKNGGKHCSRAKIRNLGK
jgi:hypothetical protein